MRGRRAPSRLCPPAKPDQGESNVGLRGAMAASFVACWAPLSLRTGQTRGNDQGFSLARRSGGLRSVVLTPPLGRQIEVGVGTTPGAGGVQHLARLLGINSRGDPGFTATDFNEHRGSQTARRVPRPSCTTR